MDKERKLRQARHKSRSRSRSDRREKRKRHRSKSRSRSRSSSKSQRIKKIPSEKLKTSTKNKVDLNLKEEIISEDSTHKQEQIKREVYSLHEPAHDEITRLEQLFGIKDFDTSKNKSHVDTDESGVFKPTKSKITYRQFMNRRGGFNKAVDV